MMRLGRSFCHAWSRHLVFETSETFLRKHVKRLKAAGSTGNVRALNFSSSIVAAAPELRVMQDLQSLVNLQVLVVNRFASLEQWMTLFSCWSRLSRVTLNMFMAGPELADAIHAMGMASLPRLRFLDTYGYPSVLKTMVAFWPLPLLGQLTELQLSALSDASLGILSELLPQFRALETLGIRGTIHTDQPNRISTWVHDTFARGRMTDASTLAQRLRLKSLVLGVVSLTRTERGLDGASIVELVHCFSRLETLQVYRTTRVTSLDLARVLETCGSSLCDLAINGDEGTLPCPDLVLQMAAIADRSSLNLYGLFECKGEPFGATEPISLPEHRLVYSAEALMDWTTKSPVFVRNKILGIVRRILHRHVVCLPRTTLGVVRFCKWFHALVALPSTVNFLTVCLPHVAVAGCATSASSAPTGCDDPGHLESLVATFWTHVVLTNMSVANAGSEAGTCVLEFVDKTLSCLNNDVVAALVNDSSLGCDDDHKHVDGVYLIHHWTIRGDIGPLSRSSICRLANVLMVPCSGKDSEPTSVLCIESYSNAPLLTDDEAHDDWVPVHSKYWLKWVVAGNLSKLSSSTLRELAKLQIKIMSLNHNPHAERKQEIARLTPLTPTPTTLQDVTITSLFQWIKHVGAAHPSVWFQLAGISINATSYEVMHLKDRYQMHTVIVQCPPLSSTAVPWSRALTDASVWS